MLGEEKNFVYKLQVLVNQLDQRQANVDVLSVAQEFQWMDATCAVIDYFLTNGTNQSYSNAYPHISAHFHSNSISIKQQENTTNPATPAINHEELYNKHLQTFRKLNMKEKGDYKRKFNVLKNSFTQLKQSFQLHHLQRYQLFQGSTDSTLIDVENGDGSDIRRTVASSESLDRSSQLVNSYLDSGRETLRNLMQQRERLKSAQTKVLDILNYLGISNSTMRAIEGRDATDRVIVFVGMALILILLFVIWYFVKRR